MKTILKYLFNFGFLIFFSVLFASQARAEVGTPEIISLTFDSGVILTGTAPANSEILFYLNGNFIGQTEATEPEKADCQEGAGQSCRFTWSWRYLFNEPIPETGFNIMAVAKDKTSLVLSAPTSEFKLAGKIVPAPTITTPSGGRIGELNPTIIGLSQNDNSVKIYIDGNFDGQTEILKDQSGAASFSYQPAKKLSLGRHTFYAVAEDVFGRLSQPSESIELTIEAPLPAPTVFPPVFDYRTGSNRPFIVGVTKNNTIIKLYIDRVLASEINANNHVSGTASFSYQPAAPLNRGCHTASAIAVDQRGKLSAESKAIEFLIKNSSIADSAREENRPAEIKISEPVKPGETKPIAITISSSTGAVLADKKIETLGGPAADITGDRAKTLAEVLPGEQSQAAPARKASPKKSPEEKRRTILQALAEEERLVLEKINNLVGGAQTNLAETQEQAGGIANQIKSKFKLSVVIFLIFLFGVVAWLIWVNRELAKERRAEKADKNSEASQAEIGQKDKLF